MYLVTNKGHYFDDLSMLGSLKMPRIHCLLQNDSSLDEHGVAAAIVPLATTFCRVSFIHAILM